MEDLLKAIKIDSWWKVVLILGVIFVVSSMYYSVIFLENKHLFGLGLGMILTGIAFWIADKTFSTIKSPNAYTGPAALISWKEIHHNPFSMILLALGTILIIIFGFLIIVHLI